MKIRYRQTLLKGDGMVRAGTIAEVDEATARDLVSAGIACGVEFDADGIPHDVPTVATKDGLVGLGGQSTAARAAEAKAKAAAEPDKAAAPEKGKKAKA